VDVAVGRKAGVPGDHVVCEIKLSEKRRPSWAAFYDASEKS
jgi:hypothetical protein